MGRTPGITMSIALLAACALVPPAAASGAVHAGIALPRGILLGGVHVDGRIWVQAELRGQMRVVEVDLERGRPTGREVRVGGIAHGHIPREAPWPVFAAGGGVWVSDPAGAAVVRIDPRRARVTARVPVSSSRLDRAGRLGFGRAGLWSVGGSTPPEDIPAVGGIVHTLVRLDPVSGAVVGTAALGPKTGSGGPSTLVVGSDRIWTTPTQGRIHLRETLLPGGPGATLTRLRGGWRTTTYGGDAYTTSRTPCNVVDRRPGTGPSAQVPIVVMAGSRCGDVARSRVVQDLAVRRDGVWVLYRTERAGSTSARVRRAPGLLVRRSPDGRTRRFWTTGRTPMDLIPTPHGMWVLDSGAHRLTRVPLD